MVCQSPGRRDSNVGALIIKKGFGSPLYFYYNKEPQIIVGHYLGSYTRTRLGGYGLRFCGLGWIVSMCVTWGMGCFGNERF